MRRKLLLIVFIIISIIVLFIKYNEEELRVRIIPFDNSEESLIVKEEVKGLTIEFLEDNYNSNFNKYKTNISSNIEEFNKSLIKYEAISSLTMHTFYDKTYNGNSVKNETVLTFLVEIKEAKGDNWWGIIYPKFLDIESSDEIEYKSYIVEKIKEWFNE